MKELKQKLVEIVDRELGTAEMVMASPMQLQRLKAERITRHVLAALEEWHRKEAAVYKDGAMMSMGESIHGAGIHETIAGEIRSALRD